ncbi:MAG: ATP-binding cassette domain-containing protein [Candidatus Eremiobacteraeota bacterium]|nr:ATP-binding cassette domain-containing protein [Candidatus Eremiobacteraeota bacterium]
MISAKGLTKFYGEKCAINDVTFEVEKGEILGFLGPNAAGKTTTMRILTGYFPPTSGEAKVAGYDIFEQSLEVRKRIGYLPENFPLYKDMKVVEFLHFVAAIKGVPPRERKSSIAAIIDKCGLSEEAENLIGRLSKGYCQRVGIAQAIINEPDVLILDEPTVGLDPNQIVEIRTLIKSLAGKSTVILSSHILDEVAKTCERVIIINNGRILTIDTPQHLSDTLQISDRVYLEVAGPQEKIESLLPDIRGVLKVDKVTPLREDIFGISLQTEKNMLIRKEIAEKLVNEGLALYELRPIQLTLEEIFTEIVKKGGVNN